MFQACLNSVVPFTLIAWAQQTTDAGLATILNSTSPIFAFLLTVLITRHEVVTTRKLFGVCAGLIGICLIVGVEALSGLGTRTLGSTSPSLQRRSAMQGQQSSERTSKASTR